MKLKNLLINGGIYFVICILFYSFLLYATAPINDGINFCERKGWNGETFDTGRRAFFDKENMKFKCNKDPSGETDAIVMIVKSIHFMDAFSKDGEE